MTSPTPPDPSALVEEALAGNRRAVGRLLTFVEQGGVAADAVTRLMFPHAKQAEVIGITGAPGAGKSTLVAGVVRALTEAGRRPAVIAVDPSSPLTGGAILGDRVRMAAVDTTAFIRSVSTRGHAGGLALSIPGAVRVLDASGYDPIIIETVGVGQVEVDVASIADTTVVVATPGMGDAVQANKAGLMEVADVFVVNKADRPGAADTRRDIELMLDLSHVTGAERDGYRPPIISTTATEQTGIAELIDAIAEHRRWLRTNGQILNRRVERARFELASRIDQRIDQRLRSLLATPSAEAAATDIANGTQSPVAAAADLLEQLRLH
ncbi:MAG: methylmalonyl Co-A mutase-associated GTPase MeaB [Acidimicrobiia bacterium]|nr:methylmalonyl Co-A mutase-associated GTPase MeaB [Acidimicrobiia bacterium]